MHSAARRVGITKTPEWHSCRRTFATLLKGGGKDVKAVQVDRRWDVYTQVLTPAKRAIHLKLIGLIQPAAETANGPLWTHTDEEVAVGG